MAKYLGSPAPLWRKRVPIRERSGRARSHWRIVDIPFPRPVRDALLADGLAEEHHWIPNSGWTTFRVRTEEDLNHGLWLLRLSYVRYALKTAADARVLLERESEKLRLSPQFRSLLEKFVPLAAKHAVAEPVAQRHVPIC